jgi:hypothetical protein
MGEELIFSSFPPDVPECQLLWTPLITDYII